MLDKGRIVEESDHHILLQRGGLWVHQSGGFLGEEIDDDDAQQVATQAVLNV